VSYEKALRWVNQMILANGGTLNQPTYFPEGSEPLQSDTELRLLQKLVGALANLAEVLNP
jgi:hypothetical protein